MRRNRGRKRGEHREERQSERKRGEIEGSDRWREIEGRIRGER